MTIKSIFIAAASFLISTQAYGLEEVRWKNSNEGLYFTVLHEESEQFFVEVFLIRPGQLQENISKHQFSSLKIAKNYFNQETTTFSDKISLHLKEAFVSTEDKSQYIWLTENEWNVEWERQFGEWIKNVVTPEYLYNHNVAVDCADVPIALRWIFARMNGLPAANHLAITGVLFSNESFQTEWEMLPTHINWHEDERFLASLDYLLKNTYTHSLMSDLYPIEITGNFIAPGTVFLNLYNDRTGHTELVRDFIHQQDHPAPLRVIAGTVPRALRLLTEYGFRPWKGSLTENKQGFFRFRWPILNDAQERVLISKDQMPGFSLEQFAAEFTRGYRDYAHAVIARVIPGWRPNLKEQMKVLTALILERLTARVEVVQKGYEHCSTFYDCEEGSEAWEAWSTPSRDNAIYSIQKDIEALMNDSQCDRNCERELTSKYEASIIRIRYRTLRLREALYIWENQTFSSDPNDSVAKRWGLE